MSLSTAGTLSPQEVAQDLVSGAVYKHHTRLDKIFFKAVLAGAYLSFGGLMFTIFTGGAAGLTASNPGILRVIGAFVFPVGLVMIVLTGQELLTSNMMTMPMAVMKRKVPIWSLPLNWIVVFFGNLCGSLFFAAVITKYSGVVGTEPYVSHIKAFVITKAVTPNWREIFIRGIGCNWLVCIAVWLGTGAKDTVSKIVALYFPIWIFVACSFDHVIANMFSIPLGILYGADLTVNEYIRKSLLASFFGNIVGALFVAVPAVYFYLDEEDEVVRAAEMGKREPSDDASSNADVRRQEGVAAKEV